MGKYDSPDAVGDVNHFQALTTALSATVGIGNIAGVAVQSIMVDLALFLDVGNCFLRYGCKIYRMYTCCEISYPKRWLRIWWTYVLHRTRISENWKWLAVFFAAMAVICSFLTGNAVQANTVADTLSSTFMIPGWITGLVTASIVGFVIIGGIKRIGKVTASLMPIMAIIYVLGGANHSFA